MTGNQKTRFSFRKDNLAEAIDLPKNSFGQVCINEDSGDDAFDGVLEDNTAGAEVMMEMGGNQHLIGGDGAFTVNMSLENSKGFQQLQKMMLAKRQCEEEPEARLPLERNPYDLSDLRLEVGDAPPSPAPRAEPLRQFASATVPKSADESGLCFANFCPCCNHNFTEPDRYCPRCGTKRLKFRPASE